MPAVTVSGMLAAEAAALADGWTEESLLDLAGERLGRAIGRYFPHPGLAVGYLGKGHNAGDALVALRILHDEFGWSVSVRAAFPPQECADLTRQKWSELDPTPPIEAMPVWRDAEGTLLLLDGLLGTGTKGAMRDPLLPLAAEMEWLRQNAGARVAAVDLPSGIDADTGEVFPGAVTADITFMIGNPKQGLLAGHAADATGALALVPVEPLTVSEATGLELISPQTMAFGKSPRPFDFHKGMAGRVAIVAGSPQYTGAAVLAALGALRGGAGLVTLHVPENAAAAIVSRCPPEIIVRTFSTFRETWDIRADSQVVGCGLGDLEPAEAGFLLDWIAKSEVPTVVDADALNLIAKSGALGILNPNHVITPHPGEFKRLAPDLAEHCRESAARSFTDRIPTTLLLKGSRTIVARAGQPSWCNATGTPGMATGGQGDLLAGVIGARLAIGDPPHEAAAFAAWLCGRAAEIALCQPNRSEESLTPQDVADCLGRAYGDWRHSRR